MNTYKSWSLDYWKHYCVSDA